MLARIAKQTGLKPRDLQGVRPVARLAPLC